MVSFLSAHRSVAALLAAVYFLALVFFHDAATAVADWLKFRMTLPYYNLFLFLSGLIFALISGYYLLKKIILHPEKRIFFFGFLFTLILIFQAFFTMMVVNMEAIHFVQYALMAIILLPLTRRFEDAFIIASVLGMADEIFQYLILNPDFKYFDFNDILLNMLGAGSGLLFFAVQSRFAIKAPRPWYKSSSLFFIAVVMLLGMVISTGRPVSFFPPLPGERSWHWFSLYRNELAEGFWTPLYENRHYHIFRPWEGIFAIVLLTALFSRIDAKYFKTVTHPY